MDQRLKTLLQQHLDLMDAAVSVLKESHERVSLFRDRLGPKLSVGERESCEALTSRFARLNDLLTQRIFRTIDQIELVDEWTVLDRLNRMAKRGVLVSAARFREQRELRNSLVHDYLVESADAVLTDSLTAAPALWETAGKLRAYAQSKGYV